MRMYFVAALLAATIVGSASASPGIRVAFVVDVSFAAGESTVTSSIPGCPSATVTTSGGAGFGGPIGRFFGTKTFDCGASGTFTLSFRAHAFGCNPTDSGTWMMVEGTGMYAGISGQGQLAGTYYGAAPCEFDGVLDSYTGTIKLAAD